MQRDASISIAKAVAIILMVIGHTEYPGLLTSCLYTFHMPLFFITAGYFFSPGPLPIPGISAGNVSRGFIFQW